MNHIVIWSHQCELFCIFHNYNTRGQAKQRVHFVLWLGTLEILTRSASNFILSPVAPSFVFWPERRYPVQTDTLFVAFNTLQSVRRHSPMPLSMNNCGSFCYASTTRLEWVCCQAGPFSWGRPIALSLYIFITWFCATSAECRASSDVAICRQSVSQAVGGLESNRAVVCKARLRALRWSIVAWLIND